MRKYLVVFVMLILPGPRPGFSQDSNLELLRNEFAINLFSYIQRPVVQDGESCYPVFFHGILYSRDLSKNLFVRARFDYFQRNRDHSTEDNMDLNLYSDILMGGGLGYAFGRGAVRPHVGADLMMTSVLQYTENGGEAAGSYEKIQMRSLGGALLPFAGISFQVTSILSFSLETSVELGYLHKNGTDFTWGNDHIPIEENINDNVFIYRWNPVSMLSVALSF